MLSLTDDEKTKVFRYLRYPNWESLAQSFQLGYPSESDPQFLVRAAFDRISDKSVQYIREAICNLDAIKDQRMRARKRFEAIKVGEITLNSQQELDLLGREEEYWTGVLRDQLGVEMNPWSSTARGVGGMGGMNAKVVG
jgi:hypothetical protein